VVIVVAVIAISAFGYFVPSAPKSPNQVALNKTVAYFVHNYDPRVGLISGTPGGNTYWLYSDNYLASLALSRYDSNNQSTTNFALAISQALGGYAATLPQSDVVSQYTALNSTSAAFSCPLTFLLSWSAPPSGQPPGPGSATIETTANNGDSSCASQNYADILMLQAILGHVNGSTAQATIVLQKVRGLFDGTGFADIAFANSNSSSRGVYQTYKLALYVIASTCLGASSTDTSLPTIEGLMLHLQENSTGGFFSGYTSPGNHGSTVVNTETTALASLALKAMLDPSAAC
jgi:hypothetical protein